MLPLSARGARMMAGHATRLVLWLTEMDMNTVWLFFYGWLLFFANLFVLDLLVARSVMIGSHTD